jgi:hypothetical protein
MRRTQNQKTSQPAQGQQQQQQQQRKSSPTSRSPRRPSSRELLTDALRRAQRAVELDSAESDVPSAIAAYDDAIALLQRVIERRSKKPTCTSEVERVTNIVSNLLLLLSLRIVYLLSRDSCRAPAHGYLGLS